MRTALLLIAFCAGSVAWTALAAPGAGGARDATEGRDAAPRFGVVEVWAQTHGRRLAAWQVELNAHDPAVTITGVEGGDHPAFARPPYYDPKAIQEPSERIILAAYRVGPADELPRGAVRLATVHYLTERGVPPTFKATLTAAADPDERPIPLKIDLRHPTAPEAQTP